MSLCLHVFDVGSDIFVLVDLYGKDIKLFSTCLGIIILSFFASSMISCLGQTDPDVIPGEIFENTNIHQNSCKKRFLKFLTWFFSIWYIYRSLLFHKNWGKDTYFCLE